MKRLSLVHLNPRQAITLLALAIGILMVALEAQNLYREYNQTIEEAGSKTQNLARLLEEHARQSLRRIELALLRANDELQRTENFGAAASAGAVGQRLTTLLPTDGLIRSFEVLDRDGTVVLSTLNDDVRGLPGAGDLDFFLSQRDRSGLGMVIGKIVRSRVTGNWTLPVSVRLDAPGGEFRGVLLASVESNRLQDFYDSIHTGANGFVTLWQRQGWMIVRSPYSAALLERNWDDTPIFRTHLPRSLSGTVRQVMATDKVERIYSYRALQDFPVIVSIGMSLTDILAPWRARVWRDVIVLLLVLGILGWAISALLGQLRKREAMEKGLAESEARFRGLAALSSDGFWEQDNEFRFTFVSKPLGDATGTDVRTYLGKRRWDLPALNLTEAYWARHRAQLQRHEPFRDLEKERPVEGGRSIWLSISGEPVFDSCGVFQGYRGVGSNITARKQHEALLTGEKQVLEMIARNEPLEATLTAIVRIIETQAPDMLCSVLLLDADGQHLRHGAAPSLPEAYTRAIDGVAIGENVGSCGAAAYRREQVIVEDIATDPLWADYRELALGHDLRACWSTPILDAQRKVLGTFAMYYRQPGRPSAYQESLIDVATHTSAIAIGRREAGAALRNAMLRLEIALEGSQISVWESDLRSGEIWLDANWASYLGMEPGETRTRVPALLALTHADDRQSINDAIARVVQDRVSSYAVEHRVKSAGGEWKWVLSRGRVIERDAGGRPLRLSGTNTDITGLKQAGQALQREHKRLRVAQDAARMVVLDWHIAEDRLECKALPQWLRGPLAEGAVRYPLFKDQIHPEDRARFVAARLAAVSAPDGPRQEFRFVRTDGEMLWLRAHHAVMADSQGVPVLLITALYDITEQKRVEAQLIALNAELESKVASRTEELSKALEAATAADRAKSEFMANVTHELRTPLNSVIGFAELLRDEVAGPLNPKQSGFAADALAGGQRLLALVEGILEMSRLDSSGAALRREPVQIAAMLQERLGVHSRAAGKHGVTMRLDVAPDVASVELDPKALRRMLDALLDNAVRFNREGGQVELSARREDGMLEISVADCGIGISAQDLDRLFKPLVQLDAGLARHHDGIGLGLALARRLAEMHGGRITVASEPGKGSRFILHLPTGET
jgi:PAS domain S-box-containing protein